MFRLHAMGFVNAGGRPLFACLELFSDLIVISLAGFGGLQGLVRMRELRKGDLYPAELRPFFAMISVGVKKLRHPKIGVLDLVRTRVLFNAESVVMRLGKFRPLEPFLESDRRDNRRRRSGLCRDLGLDGAGSRFLMAGDRGERFGVFDLRKAGGFYIGDLRLRKRLVPTRSDEHAAQ